MIEDAAQAHGTRYKGSKVGRFGEMACFSHYPSKNLGSFGERGSITTDNKSYFDRLCKLRVHSNRDKYYYDELGFNMRMGGVEAAVLSIKLKYLDQWNARRGEIARMYFSEINNPKIKMQHQPEWAESCHHLFVVTISQRDNMIRHLNDIKYFQVCITPFPAIYKKFLAIWDIKKEIFQMPNIWQNTAFRYQCLPS